MELSTIEMPVEEARAALDEWADAKMRNRSDEDDAIAAGYRALAEGRALISLSGTIRAGGEDDDGKPRLAVGPVTSEVIYLDRPRNGDVRFCVAMRPGGWRNDVSTRGIALRDVLTQQDHQAWHAHNYERWDGTLCWSAMVPVVPPRFRARGWRGAHVLFEAEWSRHELPAPVDPALISHLRGDLWVVLGIWDLTPLERAVLVVERNF